MRAGQLPGIRSSYSGTSSIRSAGGASPNLRASFAARQNAGRKARAAAAGRRASRPSAAVELEGEAELRHGAVDRFDRLDAVAAEIMVGVLQIGLGPLQRVDRVADAGMALARLGRG